VHSPLRTASGGLNQALPNFRKSIVKYRAN
jgi:hypothetical protein